MKTPNWVRETDITTSTYMRDDPCSSSKSEQKAFFSLYSPPTTKQTALPTQPNPTLACSGHYFSLFHPLFAHLGREGKIVGVPLDSPSKWRTGGINAGTAKKHCLDQFDSGG